MTHRTAPRRVVPLYASERMIEDAEALVEAECRAGRFERAIECVLERYGEEVFSFLVSRIRNEDRASDVFSQACEDVWKSLPNFEWRCSMRTWFYRLARNAATREGRSPANRPNRRIALSQVSQLAASVRSRTRPHLRTEVKDQVRKLRDQLEVEEQTLLILRVDRSLSWNEIATIMVDDAVDEPSVARASARLRQRFQSLKVRLRQLAISEGLIEAGE